MLVIHNEELCKRIQASYNLEEIRQLERFLQERQVFSFPSLKTGLFSAAGLQKGAEYTGYKAVWIRDNVFVARSLYLRGKEEDAIRCARALLRWVIAQRSRFESAIEAGRAPKDPMLRPHVRFDGEKFAEIDETWNHAQNDAWGYCLWFCCQLVRDSKFELSAEEGEAIALLVFYFWAIAYWQDEDSGHWEEAPKVEASSIGVVVAALKSLRDLLSARPELQERCHYEKETVGLLFLEDLIQTGREALYYILPYECVRETSAQKRAYDGALFFLIYPLNVVRSGVANLIVSNALYHLQGDRGIRRYLGDSFWCRDYADIPEEIRTSVASDREAWLQERDRTLRPGEEAQWCIFDPIASAIFGMKYQQTKQRKYLELQTHYLNRSLGQITGKDSKFGPYKCPELYYMQGDKYLPSDATPLLWTQANLSSAFVEMEKSLRTVNAEPGSS